MEGAEVTVTVDALAEEATGTPAKTPLAHARPRSLWKTTGNVLGTLVATVVVMVAAVVLVVAIGTRLSSKQQYMVFGHPVLTVISGSMGPAINTGDLIFDDRVTPTQATELHVGQIITFSEAPRSTTYINHRIVGVVHKGGAVFYETKGDANNAPDATLRPSTDIIGVYSWKISRGGYFLYNLHKPVVLALLMLAPILWFVGEPLRRWAREEDDQPADNALDSAEVELP